MITTFPELSQIRWLRALNNSNSLTIPAFGLVRVVSVDTTGILTVDRPNTDSQDVLVNGPVPILPSGYGVVTWDDPIHVYYDTGDGTPAAGEAWGAEASSYKLSKSSTGFKILGGATSGRVVALRSLASGNVFSGARVTRTVDQSITTATLTSINYTSEIFDTDAYHDNATNNTRLTAPSTSKYLVGAAAQLTSPGVSDPDRQCFLAVKKNGTDFVVTSVQYSPVGLQSVYLTCSTVLELSAGDYLETQVYHDYGSTRAVFVSTDHSPIFWITRLF